jgi:hypothetical protein
MRARFLVIGLVLGRGAGARRSCGGRNAPSSGPSTGAVLAESALEWGRFPLGVMAYVQILPQAMQHHGRAGS